jgi:hypothetical protein
MTPADGSGMVHLPKVWHALAETRAILLHGGRTLLLIEGAPGCLPSVGMLMQGGQIYPWRAKCWQTGSPDLEEWCGLAVLETLPASGAEIHDTASEHAWRFGGLPHVDVSPRPLADLVRKSGVDCRDVFTFLTRHLLEGRSGTEEAKAHQEFARNFFTSAAERDGFIEILAVPDCGGLYAQGWSMSLQSGPVTLASVSSGLSVREVEIATFDREDILPPGKGVCIFSKDWSEPNLQALDAVFYERDGRLLRLDVVHGSLLKLASDPAVAHVRHMLERIEGPETTRRAFRRICRPRFESVDSLSGTNLPIAAAFDHLLQAPDGSLLAIGWLLDPLQRVERMLLKSRGNLYCALDRKWCPLPRPDLNAGYAADPRFAEYLDRNETMHGFIVHVPARREQLDGFDVYLELVLDDDSCLFRPLSISPFKTGDRLLQILGAISPDEPELDRIVEEHVAPFLASVDPNTVGRRRGKECRMIPLGARQQPRAITAILPFRTLAELQPIFGILAGAPEAHELELALVTTRATASAHLKKLDEAFRFYGLSGGVTVAPDESTVAAMLDAGVSATTGARILCWMPSVLPKAPGWLAALREDFAMLPQPGLVSPAITYEDESIYFGGRILEARGGQRFSALAGYFSDWLQRDVVHRVSAGAAEVALIDREVLIRAGGFTGHLFSDCFISADLAGRLRQVGADSFSTGAVEFWMLDETHAGHENPKERLLRKVDAVLLGQRARMDDGAPLV